MARWWPIELDAGTDDTVQVVLNPVIVGGISGWTMQFSVRPFGVFQDWTTLGGPILTKTTTLGSIVIADATACVVNIAIARGDTNPVSVIPGMYAYSLDRTDPGNSYKLAEGTFYLKPAIRPAS